MIAISKVSLLSPWVATRAQTATQGYVDQAISTVKKYAPEVARTFDGWVNIVVGFLGLLWGSIGSTFFKDNTAADWLSKIGIVVGGIFSVLGLSKLYKYSANKKQEPQVDAHFQLSTGLANNIKSEVVKIADIDPGFKKLNFLTSKLTKGNVEQSLRTSLVSLFKHRISNEFKDKITGYSGGSQMVIDNANGPNEPLNYFELKDYLALLAGNIVSLRTDDSSDFYKELIETHLKDSDVDSLLQDGDIRSCKCDLLKLLPDDFNLVYAISRRYDRDHNQAGQDKSVLDTFNRDVEKDKDLEVKLATQGRSTEKDNALNYLSCFENQYNYIKVVRQAITYVLSVERENNQTDPKKARNAAILRNALVMAFRLKGKNFSEIHEQLDKILRGDPSNTGDKKGVDAKLKEMEVYFGKIKDMILRGKTQISYENVELVHNSIFPRSLELIRFKEQQPQPVS